ncbi:MAG: M20 family metallopeptidase, partial [Clostridiales Family XIII bacterium]|nr:M20 family metallopeptidase [Clostridiales Family XIII bacterium]
TPDGEFPICNIEKGVMDVEMLFPIEENPGEGLFLTAIDGGTATGWQAQEILFEAGTGGRTLFNI